MDIGGSILPMWGTLNLLVRVSAKKVRSQKRFDLEQGTNIRHVPILKISFQQDSHETKA